MKLKVLFEQERYKPLKSLPDWLRSPERIGVQIQRIRALLGMTQTQLARRSGQYLRMIQRLESEEVDPRLSSLKKAAEGLDCELIVRLVPRQPIQQSIRQRAEQKADQLVKLSVGTAALEEQQPAEKYIKQQREDLVRDLASKRPSLLWDD